MNDTSAKLPEYRSHKTVWALKIADIDFNHPAVPEGGALIVPENTTYAPFAVEAAYVKKHEPKAGGYYVVYRDGYKSWSPASEFEDGYTAVGAP